jgi:molybdate transport system ATP-binding protein
MPVTWVLNGEGVDVLPHDAPASADPRLNCMRCQLREVLPLGEISLCTLVPEGLPDERITLNLTGRVLHRLGAGPGQWVQLELAPEALHIMPVR